MWEVFHDPKDGRVKVDGDSVNVSVFQKLPESQQIIVKLTRWEVRDKHMVIKDGELAVRLPFRQTGNQWKTLIPKNCNRKRELVRRLFSRNGPKGPKVCA